MQTATSLPTRKPGAGLNIDMPEVALSENEQVREKLRKVHYIYMPGGAPGAAAGSPHYGDLWVGDRETISIQYVMRGVINPLKTFSYRTRNQSPENLMKENKDDQPEFVYYTMLAGEQAHELFESYNDKSMRRGLCILHSISGKEPELVQELEGVIQPSIPGTIVEIVRMLFNESVSRVKAITDPKKKSLAGKLLTEMQTAANQALTFHVDYVNKAEGEQVARSKPGGVGKLELNKVDEYYFNQLGRQPSNANGSLLLANAAANAQADPVTKDCADCGNAVPYRARLCHFCRYEFEKKVVK